MSKVKTIWKFPIPADGQVIISMPGWAEILTAQVQHGTPCIWAMVDPLNEEEKRYFEIFGTGQLIPVDIGIERKYISTFQINGGEFVYHLFERI